MLDLKKANEIVRKAKRETEIYRTKLVPYAKKIKLYSKRGTLFEKLYRVIEFEIAKKIMITTGTPTKKRTSFGINHVFQSSSISVVFKHKTK